MTQARQESSHAQAGDQQAVAAEHNVEPRWKRIAIIAGVTIAVVIALFWGVNKILFALSHQSTDDAYVDGHASPVSSRVAGTVLRLLVKDNQFVKKGQLLVQLDPRDYTVQVQQAQAALAIARKQAGVNEYDVPVAVAAAHAAATQATGNVASAQAAITAAQANAAQAKAGVAQSKAQLAQTNANLAQAAADYRRYLALVRQGAISQQQYDQALASLRVAQANRDAAADNVRAAQSKLVAAQDQVTQARAQAVATRGSIAQAQAERLQVSVVKGQAQSALASVQQAEAQLRATQLNLSYTNIIAPASGWVGNRTVEVGQRLQPGQALLSIVQENPWISANFKETQLEKMRPGQSVAIHIDAFPHRTFHGHVNSLAPASGAQFALLPPENATGNFTKIVQRIPVKITFDRDSIRGYEGLIRPGMSCEVYVHTG